MQTNQKLSEQDMMTDALNTEKLSITSYGSYLAEATCPQLRQEIKQIIAENQQVQYEIYDTMRQRGWYQSKSAEMNELQQTVQKLGQLKQGIGG
ncbi:MAG: spore coat protein [Clostridiaceae bacterium]|jgi:spore coat protein F|nr:spore coat protein [Clostridiaceae bacterium]